MHQKKVVKMNKTCWCHAVDKCRKSSEWSLDEFTSPFSRVVWWGRKMRSDGLGQVADCSWPKTRKRHAMYNRGLYPSPQCHTATSSNPSIV